MLSVAILAGYMWLFTVTDLKDDNLPMPPDGRAILAHYEGCKRCQELDEYKRPVPMCDVAVELHREYITGNEYFRLSSNGNWIYDGKPIPGVRWDVVYQKWVKR